MSDATVLLDRLQRGDRSASAELLPIVYRELRALAGHFFQPQPLGHTLQPTALVHEAYIRLISGDASVAGDAVRWEGRAHFMAVAAQAMRHVLIDHSRGRRAAKRGGDDWQGVTLDEAVAWIECDHVDILDLDEALTSLAGRSDRQARIVELRVFGGLTIDEVAGVLNVGPTTVKSEWAFARAWLKKSLAGSG
jgi:RNA polymerase sigma factor (TIGR02999 family)